MPIIDFIYLNVNRCGEKSAEPSLKNASLKNTVVIVNPQNESSHQKSPDHESGLFFAAITVLMTCQLSNLTVAVYHADKLFASRR